jgi:hypothetical protein
MTAPASALTLASILASRPGEVAASTVAAEVSAAWRQSARLGRSHTLAEILGQWRGCATATGTDPFGAVTDRRLLQEGVCEGLILLLGEQSGNPAHLDPVTYRATRDVFSFAERALPSPYRDQFIAYLKLTPAHGE